jgi:uncharacterized protein YjbI with pentapeptide repeats
MTETPEDKTAARDLLEWLGFPTSADWSKARLLGGVFGVVLALFFLAAFVAAASVIYGTIRDVFAADRSGPNLGAGALITALLGAPFLIWSTVIKHKALGFQKEGHLTDRISKAVEQLGAEKTVKVPKPDGTGSEERTLPNIEVRIGGILSLERIAQDSTAYDKGRDHVRCMEILCTYIRENAPAKDAKEHDLGDWESLNDDPTDAERKAHLKKRNERFGKHFSLSKAYQWAQTLSGPRADIAQALQVIGRRTKEQRQAEARWGKDASPTAEWVFDTACPILPDADKDKATTAAELEAYRAKLEEWKAQSEAYKGYRLDLRKTNLQAADLSGLILSAARLDKARMEGTILWQARMEGANLQEARMEGANLWQARMEVTDLSEVRMEGANLSRARMEGANLWQARMEGAVLSLAHMEGAFLWQARMEGAYLQEARMEGAYLHEARMEGAYLNEARMEGANLSRARMEGACLVEARMDEHTSLRAATLRDAALREVDYSNVSLSLDQIKSSFGDASVLLPNGITPDSPDWPNHWPKSELDYATFDAEWREWLASPATYTPPPP